MTSVHYTKAQLVTAGKLKKHNLILLYTTVCALRTRKLSYRKDDRAMRPTYGCREKCRESLSTPMVTFDEIFNGLLFRLIL